MIDLAALRALIAVRDHGSIVAAATALGFTPSAISQQIKKLERQSRAPVLERVGRSVILTERGRLLAERGTHLLADLEQISDLAQAGADEVRGSFRLASFSTATRGLVTPLLARLLVTAPDLTVTVTPYDPRDSVTIVERGIADLAIVQELSTLPLDIPATIERQDLFVDEADVVVWSTHPLAESGSVTPLDLVGEAWVATAPGTIGHDWILHMFAMHGHRPDIRYVDVAYATHVAMAEHGVAVALLPRLSREPLPPGVRSIRVVDPTPRRTVSLLWRASSRDNPARRHVQAELERLFPRS